MTSQAFCSFVVMRLYQLQSMTAEIGIDRPIVNQYRIISQTATVITMPCQHSKKHGM